MHLGKLYSNFNSRCQSYRNRKIYIDSNKSSLNEWEFNYQTEVLISDVWQSWCHFTRKLLMSSCRGAVARDGSIISVRAGDNSWQRIGYEAKQASNGHNATPNGHLNFFIRKEPTWGDLDSTIKIINGLRPSNQGQLLNAYGSFSQIKDIQTVRNACAHKNIETLTSLNPLLSRYTLGKINNAPQLAWATVNGGNHYAIDQWIFEMNTIADLATSTN